MEHLSIATSGVIALLGYGVVFFGLVLLMIVVMILGKVMARSKPAAAPQAAEAAPAAEAEGTAGKIKLFDVPDRDAAMIMAIVANRIGKPLNELRFRSIKEVKDE